MNVQIICRSCTVPKSSNEYHYRKDSGKLRASCKDCVNRRSRDYYLKHSEKLRAYTRNHYKNNTKKVGEYNRKYNKQNREAAARRLRKRRKNDPVFNLSMRLRSRLYSALRKNCKSGSAVRDLGCSIDYLKEYLESKFSEGMTWANRSQWHIDHIIPLSSFDLTQRDQILKACHYTNLQPLWAKDNLRKGTKSVGTNIAAVAEGLIDEVIV